MSIKRLIETIASKKNCVVHTPAGLPSVGNGLDLPADVKEFYTLCGGVDLFTDADFPYKVLPPEKVVSSTPLIYSEGGLDDFKNSITPDDPTNTCYAIVSDDNDDYLVIDLDKERNGFCYDAFHENYGSPGDMPIIALDFTELLTKLIKNEGKVIYWLESDFPSYGDAYDNKK